MEICIFKIVEQIDTSSLVDIFSALLVPAIAILGAIIAYMQWKTNQKRLKHELFDRRYEQFEAIRNFLGSIITSGKVSQDAEQAFLIGTRGVRFIFDDEIHVYVNTYLWHLALKLQTLSAELEGVPVGEARTKNVREQAEIKKQFNEELKSIESKFVKYLQLEH